MSNQDQWRQLGENWMRWDGRTLRSVRKVADGYQVRIQHHNDPTRILTTVAQDWIGRAVADAWEVTA
mgnify:FL=1|jgi:hypothetical protein